MKTITRQSLQKQNLLQSILPFTLPVIALAAMFCSNVAFCQNGEPAASSKDQSANAASESTENSNNSSEDEDDTEDDDTDDAKETVPEKPTSTPPAKPDAPKPAATKTVDPAADAASWHLLTPDWADEKLQVRFGLGIGGGTKEFSADKLGFSLESTYSPNKNWFASVRFNSLSGVKTNSDESYVAQTFLAGAGLEQKLQGSKLLDSMRLRESGFVGFSRLSHLALTDVDSQKTNYGLALAGNFSLDFLVWEKCFLFTGIGAQFGKAMWIDAQIGAAAYF